MHTSKQERCGNDHTPYFIIIKKLVALDIVWHGYRLILTEFLLTVGVSAALAIFSLSFFIRTAPHPFFALLFGLVFVYVTLNYIPLLLYAIYFNKYKTAADETTLERSNQRVYARKYQLQSLLLFVPLVVPILAIVQARQPTREQGV